ncbi:hypothetical protein SRHO_G00080190 [Serrasalmus rhombeus]
MRHPCFNLVFDVKRRAGEKAQLNYNPGAVLSYTDDVAGEWQRLLSDPLGQRNIAVTSDQCNSAFVSSPVTSSNSPPITGNVTKVVPPHPLPLRAMSARLLSLWGERPERRGSMPGAGRVPEQLLSGPCATPVQCANGRAAGERAAPRALRVTAPTPSAFN